MFFEICKWESRTETAGPDPEIILLDPDPFGFEKPITYEPSRMFEKNGIRIRIHRILGILDPDPLVRGMDPDPNPSIINQK